MILLQKKVWLEIGKGQIFVQILKKQFQIIHNHLIINAPPAGLEPATL
jgi:hypothetical protein